MATRKQIRANRLNGRLSKGPITEDGKAASARNAFKHGLLSHNTLLPDEDAQTFHELREAIWNELDPSGARESMLVERIVDLNWRLHRLGRIEAGVLAWQHFRALAERAGEKVRNVVMPTYPYLGTFEEQRLAKNNEYLKARSEQREHEAQLETGTAQFGAAFIRDSKNENALTKLSRYETSIQRNLLRTYHELERLQAGRQGKNVPVPMAVDIDVSGAEASFTDGVDQRSSSLGAADWHGFRAGATPGEEPREVDTLPITD